MKLTVTMTKVKDCKHSVPFKTENPDAPVSTIYINRPTSTSWSACKQEFDPETGTITFSGITI